MGGLIKGIVQNVDAGAREVSGFLVTGAAFVAAYYGVTPIVGDIVFIEQTAQGSWVVVLGPANAQGLFGVGGDTAITIMQSTAADPVSRASAGDGTYNANSAAVSSASAAFTSADIGSIITSSAAGIRAGTYIQAVASAMNATMNQTATAISSTGVLTIANQAPRWSKAGTVFTLQRDLFCTNLTLDSSAGTFTLITNGFRIFCLGTFFVGIGIVVHNNGADASGRTAGGAARANTIGRAIGAGATGLIASGGPAAGATATNVTASIATISSTAILSGGHGGDAGTAVAPTTRIGGAGATIINAAVNSWPGGVPNVVTIQALGGTLFAGGAGGGSGAIQSGAGTTGTTGVSGGGGGGAGIIGIFAKCIINFGLISVNGGNGGSAAVGDASDASFGGGGGGGGGAVVLVYGASGSTIGQVQATGGTAGGGFAGTGGTGTSVGQPNFTILGPTLVVPTPSGGTGGTGATVGATGYTVTTPGNGETGLIWALPL